MKTSVSKKDRQSAILSELCCAQKQGYVLRIEVELEEKLGKIMYEPMWGMYRNNEQQDTACIDSTDDLSGVPSYNKLFVTFSSRVEQKLLNKICEYVCKTYSCKATLTDNKMTLFEFSV